jgi:hypothetical protein
MTAGRLAMIASSTSSARLAPNFTDGFKSDFGLRSYRWGKMKCAPGNSKATPGN